MRGGKARDLFFCSELVAAGLEKAGTVGKVNASEVTPIDLCRWNIYANTYFQLKGQADKQISCCNTLDPVDWNVYQAHMGKDRLCDSQLSVKRE